MVKKISDNVDAKLDTLEEVLPLQDGTKNAKALRELVQTAKNDNLKPGDVFELIQETGLGGRENLRGFIEREFKALEASQ